VGKERTAMDDECEQVLLEKVGLPVHAFCPYIEQDDGILRLVIKWPLGWVWDGKGTGSDEIWSKAAIKTDN
jgi:hypothetical protein